MNYEGKLYGKVGRKYIPLKMHSSEVDNLRRGPRCSRAAAGSVAEYREALQECWELLGEAEKDEINIRDEIEKWERAYGHLLSLNTEPTRREPASDINPKL